MTDRTQPDSGRATGPAHIIRYALELGLLWIDGSGRDKVREALDALDALEAKLASIGAGGVQALSAAPAEQSQPRYSHLHDADAVHGKRLSVYSKPPALQAAPKAAPGEPSDAEIDAFLDSPGGLEWVIADKRERYRLLVRAALAKWAAPQQEAQEPALFVSAKQLADLVDPSHATGGSYLPARKTRAGLFTQPLYTAPQPAPAPLIARSLAEWHEQDGNVAWWAWNGREWAGEPAWIGTPNCEDWPGYHTHWTPHPEQPVCAALAAQGGE